MDSSFDFDARRRASRTGSIGKGWRGLAPLALTALVACGPSSPDVDAGHDRDAGAERDATASDDAGALDAHAGGCDVDGDGDPNASCASSPTLSDCDDADPSVGPGRVECRSGRLEGCGVGDDVASAVDLAELGVHRTTVTSTVAAETHVVVEVVPLAFGELLRGIASQRGFLALGARLGVDPTPTVPSFMWDGSAAHVASDGSRAFGAVAGSDLVLYDVTGAISIELARAPVSAIDVRALPRDEPVAVAIRATGGFGELVFVDAASTRTLALAFEPEWLDVAGSLALAGSVGGTAIAVASPADSTARTIALPEGAELTGPGSLVAWDDGHEYLAVLPTDEGLAYVRFARCATDAGCGAGADVTLASFLGEAGPYGGLVAATYVDTISGPAIALLAPTDAGTELVVHFVSLDALDAPRSAWVLFGAGALDGRPLRSVRSVSLASGELYGGSFLLGAALVTDDDGPWLWTSGLVGCLAP